MNSVFPAHVTSVRQASALTLAILALAQMLPATVLTPAVRPLFTDLHGGREGAMHAFFALNMIGGAIAAPIVVSAVRRACPPRELFVALALLDALILGSFALPMSTPLLLSLRVIEGACHVAACTLLLTAAASPTRERSAVPAVGLGIMIAVAAGSVLGAVLVGAHPRAPIYFAASLLVAVAGLGRLALDGGPIEVRRRAPAAPDATLRTLASGGMVARFLVGVLVVSFALFAHRAHALTDRAIGRHFALVTVPFACATWPLARLAERRGREALLLVGMVAMGLACASLGWMPTRALAPTMIVIGLGSAAVFAALLSHGAVARDELGRARRMATLNAAGCVGMLLGPTVAGIVAACARSALDPARGQRIALLVGGLVPIAWALVQLARMAIAPSSSPSEEKAGAVAGELPPVG